MPFIDGLFTQARQLAQVPEMVADAAQLLGVDVRADDVRIKRLDADAAAQPQRP